MVISPALDSLPMDVTADALSRFFADLAPELDERRRRVVCGAAARMLGRGGIAAVSRAAGLSRNTVAAGAAEVQAMTPVPGQRARRPGAGRKSAADREPLLAAALEDLLADEQAGDGAPLLSWTLRSTYEMARELRRRGFTVSPSSVSQLLQRMGYSTSGRARPASQRGRSELRARHRCANAAAEAFAARRQPAISVRARRKERPAGAAPASAVASADGGGDGAGSAWVGTGPDLSVVEFTVEAIQRWWAEVSPRRLPHASELLVCTDAFAAAGEIHDAWKYHLARLAHATGLEITVQHIPPGTWRWRDSEPQYVYTVTQAPGGGTATCHQISIDLVAASVPGDAERPLPDGAPGGSAAPCAPDSPHSDGCQCRHTVRPQSAAGPRAGRLPSAARTLPRAAGHAASARGLPEPGERRKPKIAETVAHNIARDISTRKLRPGARLPSETAALSRFSVSRSSLREALRLLELLGVIRIKTGAGGGPVVGQVTSADFASTTTFYFHLIGVTIREILEARRILEPALVRLAVDQADPAAKGKLRGYMNSWGNEESLRPPWLAPRERSRTAGFHRALIETGNAPLDLFSHSLQDVWTVRQYLEPFPWQAAPHHDNDHWLIGQAILAGDGATAEGLMRTHMDYLYDFATANWSGLMEEVIDWH